MSNRVRAFEPLRFEQLALSREIFEPAVELLPESRRAARSMRSCGQDEVLGRINDTAP